MQRVRLIMHQSFEVTKKTDGVVYCRTVTHRKEIKNMFFVRFYDTDEDEEVAVWEEEVEEYPYIVEYHRMYKTENGEYYIHNDRFYEGYDDTPAFVPLSFEEARSWLEMFDIDKYHEEFGDYEYKDILYDEYMERIMRDAKK